MNGSKVHINLDEDEEELGNLVGLPTKKGKGETPNAAIGRNDD